MSNKPKILHLTLKRKFFDMILSGEKKEEYREVTKYWLRRLKVNARTSVSQGAFREFDSIRFANGGHFHPSLPQFDIECLGITVGEGREDWGAVPGKQYFVIKLGNLLSTSQGVK